MTETNMPHEGAEGNFSLIEVDGEPRVLDVDIGVRLAMAQPLNIRQQIEKHHEELEQYGPIHTAHEMVSIGSGAHREVKVYRLTEEQALTICALSRVPKAKIVRAGLVRTFVAWRKGKLGGDMAAVEALRQGQEAQNRDLAEQRQSIAALTHMVQSLLAPGHRAGERMVYRAPLEVLVELGAVPMGRTNLSKRVGDAMAKISARLELPLRLSRESGKRLFCSQVVDVWLETEGKKVVEAHNRKFSGLKPRSRLRVVPPQQ